MQTLGGQLPATCKGRKQEHVLKVHSYSLFLHYLRITTDDQIGSHMS